MIVCVSVGVANPADPGNKAGQVIFDTALCLAIPDWRKTLNLNSDLGKEEKAEVSLNVCRLDQGEKDKRKWP